VTDGNRKETRPTKGGVSVQMFGDHGIIMAGDSSQVLGIAAHRQTA